MNILALDLGTKTGWCLYAQHVRESGVQTFDVKRGESPGMRYLRFRRWLEEIALWEDGVGNRVRPVNLIVYEQTLGRFAHGGAQSEIAAGFATRVQEFCAERGVEHAAVHGSTLKKWTTGKGNAKKAAMASSVVARFFPQECVETRAKILLAIDDNEADAIALLEYAKAELAPKAESA